MSWRDRPYSGDDSGSRYGRRFRDNPMAWAPSLGSVAGIRICVHILFLIFIAIELLRAGTNGHFWWSSRYLAMLFGLVLLHEFGHCFGARYVGGSATEILMWPLGGLASVAPPHRPWAQFFTALAGPLVNIAGCILAGSVLVLATGTLRAIPFNPLAAYVPADVALFLVRSDLLFWVYQFFYVNYILVLFNCLIPMYPLDGGRMFQAICWSMIGYGRSMKIATTVGMVGGVLLGCYGLFTQNFLLIGIGIFGYIVSKQERMLAADAPVDDFVAQSSGGGRRGLFFGLRKGAWARRQKALADETAEVDRILEKVSREGIQSLSRRERKALSRATQHQRRREEELDRMHRL